MVASRTEKINPFIVMDVLERCQELERSGRDIIHLEVGEPDFDTPAVIKDAAVAALAEGKTQYSHSLGLLELRQAICDDYRSRYGVRRLAGPGDRHQRDIPGDAAGLLRPA